MPQVLPFEVKFDTAQMKELSDLIDCRFDKLERRIERLEKHITPCNHELIMWTMDSSINRSNSGGGAVVEFRRVYERICRDVSNAQDEQGTKPGYVRCEITCQTCQKQLTFNDINVKQVY
jgi:hypothetical protein